MVDAKCTMYFAYSAYNCKVNGVVSNRESVGEHVHYKLILYMFCTDAINRFNASAALLAWSSSKTVGAKNSVRQRGQYTVSIQLYCQVQDLVSVVISILLLKVPHWLSISII
jgi:hypothetical protein